MSQLLFADGGLGRLGENTTLLVLSAVVAIVGMVFLIIFFRFARLWIQCHLTGAEIGITDLIRMKLCKVDYGLIVRQKIALVQAGVKVSTREMEAHYLGKGNVQKVASAVIAAHKAGGNLPWREAAAIDLAGEDLSEAVKRNVDARKGRGTLDGVCGGGIQLTHDPIDHAALTEWVRRPHCGGVVTFLGTVRDLTGGRETVALDYEAYPGMAEKKLAEIEAEVRQRWPVGEVVLVHRLGRLEVGEISVAVAISCPHRAEAFEACRYVIDRLKEIVPIWKKEHWADGSTEWVHPTGSEQS